MEAKELVAITNTCWKHGIYVIVKPINNQGNYKLAVLKNGRETIGEEVYRDKAYEKITLEKKEAGPPKRIKTQIPSVHEKIQELYLKIYNKNFSSN